MLLPMHPPPSIQTAQQTIQTATLSNTQVDILPNSNAPSSNASDWRLISSVLIRLDYWKAVTRITAEQNQTLAKSLCEEHPAISVNREIFGGIPHLRGLRLSVGDVLAQIYVTGSIEGVKKIYAPDVSEDQIKEAIAYAQDFVESALSSRPQVNG
jgi:uncharacterized protein (DUF433 family)